MATTAGREVYTEIEKLKFAPLTLRTKLVRFATGYLIEKCGKYPKTEDKVAIAAAIIDTFPFLKDPKGEGYQCFYQRSCNSKPARGYIHDRLNNIWKLEAKLRRNDRKSLPDPEEECVLIQQNSANTPNQACLEMMEWLKYNSSPMEKVNAYMKKTAKVRYNNITSNENLTVKELLEEYPRLLEKGMIEQDYDQVFPNGDKLAKLWRTTFQRKVLEYAKTTKKNWRDMLSVKMELDEDEESVVALQLLPLILPPRPVKLGSNKTTRPSYIESMQSFIKFRQLTTNIPSFLESLPSGVCQPFILALGDRTRPAQAFVVIERNAIEHATLLKAVDCLFKLFYILDITYPSDCHIVWEFLQEIVYNIPMRKGNRPLSKNVASLRSYFYGSQ